MQHHRRGRQRVQHELGGGAGLEAGRAGDGLRADGGRNREVDEALEFTARIAGHEDDARAGTAGRGERAAHERRHAAGRDADDDVTPGRLEPLGGPGALPVVVLRALLGAQDGRLAAGHDRLHQRRIGPEGGRHLGGFDDAQAAARAGAHEDDAAPLAEGLGEHVGADGDAVAFALHRDQDFLVFRQHHVDDAAGRLLVDGECGGVDGFRRQGLPLRG